MNILKTTAIAALYLYSGTALTYPPRYSANTDFTYRQNPYIDVIQNQIDGPAARVAPYQVAARAEPYENEVMFRNPCADLKNTISFNSFDILRTKYDCPPDAGNWFNRKFKAFTSESSIRELMIPNFSMINFASKGIIGDTIRCASSLNSQANPLGLSHSGICISMKPKELHSIILSMLPCEENHYQASPLSEKESRGMLDELHRFHYSSLAAIHDDNQFASFTIESDGSASEVLRGIAPHVHMHCLAPRLLAYNGNVFIRPLIQEIRNDKSKLAIVKYLGRGYEQSFIELLKSVRSSNRMERTRSVFCSELAGLIYKDVGIIPDDITASNIIPENFSSLADIDLLKGHAYKDKPLKVIFAPRERGCL